MEFFTQFDHWTWWVIGVLLIVLEMFAPAAFFLWMGIAAIFTGGFLWLFPGMEWTVQVLIFSIQSILSIIVWRQLFSKPFSKSDQPNLNRRAQQYIGRTFTLEKAIENGVGQVKVDDSLWRVMCDEDLPMGSKIKVVGEDSISFKVVLAE
ncbi:MAG: NfeD family protein [Gammaproteobacteria bacterium]|nr:NfeD family protein [Gammaproteobacteria bacterium]